VGATDSFDDGEGAVTVVAASTVSCIIPGMRQICRSLGKSDSGRLLVRRTGS
jgi:hypothetical protein